MRLVIVESPFAGDIEDNVKYARACVRDSLARGEAPIASHLLYTQVGILNDDIPIERQWGIDAGLAWRAVAQASVVYTDRGISKGMQYGIDAALKAGLPVEYRTIRRDACETGSQEAGMFDSHSHGLKWGQIQIARHEPEVVASRKRFEKILHPICHTLVDIKV